MRSLRWQFKMFSCTVAISNELWKVYLSYDNRFAHRCIHVGRCGSKLSMGRVSYPRVVQTKPKRKELYVR